MKMQWKDLLFGYSICMIATWCSLEIFIFVILLIIAFLE